jgi:hypothetical protein
MGLPSCIMIQVLCALDGAGRPTARLMGPDGACQVRLSLVWDLVSIRDSWRKLNCFCDGRSRVLRLFHLYR